MDRIVRIVRIDAPCARPREAYLSVKLPEQNGAERQHWVDRTDGFTFAALSELLIAVQCLDGDFDEVVERLRAIDEHTPSSQEFAFSER